MAETPNAPKTIDLLLAADVEGALLLLSYASQSDIELQPETANTLTRAKGLFAEGKLAGDDLASFYLAMQKLAVEAAPVTVAGLRAAMSSGAGGVGFSTFSRGALPESRKAIQWYWLWTVFWLIILVAVQIYWVVGSTALTSMKQLNEERNKARYELVALREKLPKGAILENTADGKRLTETVENLRNRVDAYTRILLTWNKVQRFGLPESNGKPATPLEESSDSSDKETGSSRVDVILARTPFVLFALQGYLLPLLYGLLGACTYVLRMLSRDVRSFSYTPESHIRYKIRMVLGTLSGLAITWFFEPGSETLKSLSPLALAFVAGYSVEILFAAMDRFVTAFSTGPTNEEKAADTKLLKGGGGVKQTGEVGQ